jgi:peptidoglycan/LPS O-acetylase OafA/YrhL
VRNLYVDRLRGLGVLMVVLSHASGYIPFMFYDLWDRARTSISANGYHGVSIFFTVSGFLITSKLLAVADTDGRFSIVSFYRGRVARIAPCLVLMVLAGLYVARLGIDLFAIDGHTVRERLWYIFTFRYNMLSLPGSRIWDVLWSLSVEEVFYLCFPAFLLFVRNRKVLVSGLVAIVIVGPIMRNITGSPYLYFGNFDEIAMGVLAALNSGKLQLGSWPLRLLRYGGAFIIGANFLWTQDAHACFTWGPTLMGIGASIYLLGTAKADARPLFAFATLEKFGELSYEIYLSHMFLLIALYPVFLSVMNDTPNVQITMGYIWPVVVLVALLSGSKLIYQFYSEPVRLFIRSARLPRSRSNERPLIDSYIQ